MPTCCRASYRYCQLYHKVRSSDLYFYCYTGISTTSPTASPPRSACLPMTVSFTDKSGHMSTVSHYSRTSTSCVIGLLPGRWPSIAKMSHHDHLSQTWKIDLSVQAWWWIFVYSWIIYPSWCDHLQWPLAWACPQYICQGYKSSEFRSAQYLPLCIWSQSPSLHLIDQTTPGIRSCSTESLYRSWFTSAWHSAASGSTVRQKRLQAEYISFRTYLWVKMAVIGRPQEKRSSVCSTRVCMVWQLSPWMNSNVLQGVLDTVELIHLLLCHPASMPLNSRFSQGQ